MNRIDVSVNGVFVWMKGVKKFHHVIARQKGKEGCRRSNPGVLKHRFKLLLLLLLVPC